MSENVTEIATGAGVLAVAAGLSDLPGASGRRQLGILGDATYSASFRSAEGSASAPMCAWQASRSARSST